MRRTLLIALLIPHLILLSAGCASSAADLNAGGVTFEQRCAQPAVVKCFGFDAPEKTDRFIFPPYGHDGEARARGNGCQSLRRRLAALRDPLEYGLGYLEELLAELIGRYLAP